MHNKQGEPRITVLPESSETNSTQCRDSPVTVYFNCRVLREYALVRDEVWVQGTQIINPESVGRQADKRVNCRNAIISPGFIDLQVNGAFGVDFLTYENLEDGLQRVNRLFPSTGVTSYLPTLITSPPEYYRRTLPRIVPTASSPELGAGILGVHLEGPFISPEKKGAHPIEYIKKIGKSGFRAVQEVYGEDNLMKSVKMVTLAPELEGAEEVIRELKKRGVIASLGHTMSSLDTAKKAVQAGATKITHLFNAMRAFEPRDPSVPGLLCGELAPRSCVYFGIIADGVHTHTAALRIAYRLAPRELILVTDALAPMGLPCGDYQLGKTPITVSGNPKVATVRGTTTLCGSVATMSECVKHFYQAVECSMAYALAAATLHPAQCMGVTERIGTLNFGTDADFLLLNDELVVLATYIKGVLVFSQNPEAKADPLCTTS